MNDRMSRPVRILAIAAFVLGLAVPTAAPASAAGDGVLRVGTTQDLDSLNPWNTALLTGFEVFTINYDLLVNFGTELEPVPGFAESWTRADNGDGTFTWTFKIPEGRLWSDGEPATAEDARWTLQFVLDAVEAESYVGLGYLDPDLANVGVTKVEAPDATTLVLTNTDPSDRILQMYIPILPEHIWKDQTLDSVSTFENPLPVVGTGPYQAVKWETGQYVELARNPNYIGTKGAPDSVVIQFFDSQDVMVQALKSGDLDYAQGVTSDQFDDLKSQPNITTVAGLTNGWTMLNLNSYSEDIPGGGASTTALRDPAFRDALGYALDKQLLIDRVLGGYGTVGTTQVPPFQSRFHVEPDNPRTFDIELAKQKLTDAGYVLDGTGQRLDKDDKPISLRLFLPTDSPLYAKTAPFIVEWFGQLGIKVTTSVFDEATLIEKELPPEAGDGYLADWDMIIWGWTGYADPGPLLQIFTTDAIGGTSDSLYSNPTYDELFVAQNEATDEAQRREIMAQMQNLFYDEAPYHMLYHEDTLAAYRTDKFAGWTNQPANGVPFFEYGSIDYTLLTDAAAATPTPAPSEAAAPTTDTSTPTATAAPAAPASSDSGMVGPILVAALVVIAVVAGFLFLRRRPTTVDEED